jgi:hypothetical protein
MTCGCKIISRKRDAPPSSIEKSVSPATFPIIFASSSLRQHLRQAFCGLMEPAKGTIARRSCKFSLAEVADGRRADDDGSMTNHSPQRQMNGGKPLSP